MQKDEGKQAVMLKTDLGALIEAAGIRPKRLHEVPHGLQIGLFSAHVPSKWHPRSVRTKTREIPKIVI
jgi:hypothetical protein